MIGRKSQSKPEQVEEAPQGFDDFAMKLGDLMRGERATLGKSLLDVQRELRIKASYIAAIENCDPSAFDTPGFIAGYVRSYARYLGMDPQEAFDAFCAESGFSVAHGMSDKASVVKKSEDSSLRPRTRDPLAEPKMPFAPVGDSVFSRIEAGAVGSSLVLIALISGIGYGGWSVLQEVQRVQVTPVEQTPTVLSELDPLDAAGTAGPAEAPDGPTVVSAAPAAGAGVFNPPSNDAFDRLYRPQALDVPVLVARDAPISTLDPDSGGVFAGHAVAQLPSVQDSSLAAAALAQGLTQDLAESPVETVASAMPAFDGQGVTVVAARPAWVQVKDEAGSILYSGVLNAGDTYVVPRDAASPSMQIGESGAVYFAVNGTTFGPAGANGSVTKNVPLAGRDLMARYSPVEAGSDDDLQTVLVELDLKTRTLAPVVPVRVAAPVIPKVLADPIPGITVVATAETWVEVTSPSGTKLFASVLQKGESYHVPQTEQAATIFSGNAGGVYFAVNGQTYGPYGQSGQFGRNLVLSPDAIQQKMAVADLTENPVLAKVVAELSLPASR